jgi:hypothetical protein
MLKKILETADFEKLADELKALYKKGDDGKYHLELEDDDAEPLHRAKEHEVGLRRIAEQKVGELEGQVGTLTTENNKLKEDLTKDTRALRDDHERAVNALKEQHTKEKAGLEATIKKIFRDDVAVGIANEIAIDPGAAELLAEKLKTRLTVEIVDGDPVTRVLTEKGEASNMSPDALKNEYLQSSKYAGILRANEASGGGASGGGRGSGASKPLDQMTEEERTKLAKEDPVRFQQLVTAAGGKIPVVLGTGR